MTTTKDLLNTKQHILLTELESIKELLDGRDIDNIPVLQDSITDHEPFVESKEQTISSAPDGVLPGQRSLFNEAKFNEAKHGGDKHSGDKYSRPKYAEDKHSEFKTNEQKTNRAVSPQSPQSSTSANTHSLSTNPFLPAHVRQRLQRDADSALLAEDSEPSAIIDASYTQQLVDQLVAHHLPKIEQELRRKLIDVVNNHNSIIKK